MNPTVLAWCLAQPAGSAGRGLGDAYLSGTERVTVGDRTVQYRSIGDIVTAATALHGATSGSEGSPAAPLRRLGCTLARFNRMGG